jgi:hypothetical protein
LDAGVTDSASVPAPGGEETGESTGKDPTNRGKLGIKRHFMVDRQRLLLAATNSGANVHDSKQREATLDMTPPLQLPGSRRGRPRKRPVKLPADKRYDYPRCRQAMRRRGVLPRVARRGIESRRCLS